MTAADVHKAGELAGRLTRDGGDVEFSYLDGYAGPAVAVTLPVTDDVVRATAGVVPPFFAGLLPESARLQALTTGARTSADDQLTLLLLVGADAIGDVQVVPAGQEPQDPRRCSTRLHLAAPTSARCSSAPLHLGPSIA